jgi:PAS domain S-box-containing protein
LGEARDRYASLYDFAPVGYATVTENGLILEANLTFADMLGVNRSELLDQRVSTYVVPEDQDAFYLHLLALRRTGEPQTCELRTRGSEHSHHL